jgi:hypothetical protein
MPLTVQIALSQTLQLVVKSLVIHRQDKRIVAAEIFATFCQKMSGNRLPSSRNTVDLSLGRATKHFPSPRCASAIQVIRLSECLIGTDIT